MISIKRNKITGWNNDGDSIAVVCDFMESVHMAIRAANCPSLYEGLAKNFTARNVAVKNKSWSYVGPAHFIVSVNNGSVTVLGKADKRTFRFDFSLTN